MILGTIFEQNSIKVRKNGVLGGFRGTPHPPWGVMEFFIFFVKNEKNTSSLMGVGVPRKPPKTPFFSNFDAVLLENGAQNHFLTSKFGFYMKN